MSTMDLHLAVFSVISKLEVDVPPMPFDVDARCASKSVAMLSEGRLGDLEAPGYWCNLLWRLLLWRTIGELNFNIRDLSY